jgi:hypothetical protein
MGQCKSEHRGLKKGKERIWDSASLRTGAIRVMHMQFLGVAVVVCKSEHQGFKKAKERTWDSSGGKDSKSLGAKTLREITLKKS